MLGTFISDRFSDVELIGRGRYGSVYKAYDKESSQEVAVKVIRVLMDSMGYPPEILREISILQSLKHSNIVRMHSVLTKQTSISLVFEYLNCDLRKVLNSSEQLSSELIRKILYQMLRALCYCHSMQFIHRDVKPENILIDSVCDAKLADFGLARPCNPLGKPYTPQMQTLWYRAPEVLLEDTHYGFPVDIWSLGCIFVELISRTPLFHGDTDIDQINQICRARGTPTENTWPGVTQLRNFSCILADYPPRDLSESGLRGQALLLAELMLQMDPKKRITARQGLKHPYFDNLLN